MADGEQPERWECALNPDARYGTCDAEQQFSDDEIDRRLGLAPPSAARPAAAALADKRQGRRGALPLSYAEQVAVRVHVRARVRSRARVGLQPYVL